MSTPMPPDPDDMNDSRADSAAEAIAAFMKATGCDPEDALSDLLCNLRHWADRNQLESFQSTLDRASYHYIAETAKETI